MGDVDWTTVTTPEGWTVTHQIAHLAWTDRASLTAIAGGEPFDAVLNLALQDPLGFVDAETERWAAELAPPEQLARWQHGRSALAEALRAVPDGTKLPWFGPPMSPTSMATARFMETWGHGHDVAEGLGRTYPQNDRCKHVCHIGVRARANAFAMNQQEDPGDDIRVAKAPEPPPGSEAVAGTGYTLYDFERRGPMLLLAGLFVAVVLAFARWRGALISTSTGCRPRRSRSTSSSTTGRRTPGRS